VSSGPPFYYSWTPARPSAPRLSTSRTELTQIGIAYAVLTLDLVILLSGGGVVFGAGSGFLSRLSVPIVLASAAAAFTGFVAHELAHKVVAQRHGFWAEFRMSPFGLIFSLFTAAVGFLWAAPGATVVSGMSVVDLPNWGRTSLAGPLTNLGFSIVFYAAAVVLFLTGSPWVLLLLLLAWVNGWFATFNLLPFGPLDGAKVLRWRATTWLLSIVGIGAFTAVTTLAYFVYGNPFLGW
jgi:Zn-dependent protease